MSGEDFEALVELWIPKYKNISPRNPTRGLSEVDIEQYVHEWNPSECRVDDKCRDIRYKYPAPAGDSWTKAKTSDSGSAERQLVTLLESSGVTADELSEAEFEQLVSQVDVEFASRYPSLLGGNGKSVTRADLKLLWPSAILPDSAPAKTREVAKPVVVPVREPSKPLHADASSIGLFEERPTDAFAAPWSVEMFELPSDDQLAKLGNTELLRRSVEASRSEFVIALAELSPNRDESMAAKSQQVWSAFLAPLSRIAARKGRRASPVQEVTRSKDDWLKALCAKDEL